jgi:RimJ/RimL family protein N-acetyltransferase
LLAAIDFGWNTLRLERIIAITSPQNEAALKLLERLRFELNGMQNDGMLLFEHKLAE